MVAAALVPYLLLVIPAVGRPAYVLETTPAKTVEATLTFEAHAPQLTAKEWVVIAPAVPELPSQTNVHSTMTPRGKETDDLGDLHRPLLVARIAAGKDHETSVVVHVKYTATLMARHLVPLKPDQQSPEVIPLKPEARKLALGTSRLLDFELRTFRNWLDENQLHRRTGEDDVAFARRVFLHITRHYGYEYREDLKRQASLVCRARKTDCGGMAVLFVATLRASKVPSRVLVGRWAESARKGEEFGDQAHVKAEFYAEGIGWVPVDPSSAVVWDRSKEGLDYFGNDDGNFVTLHVDPDLLVDAQRFGKQSVPWMQGAVHWVSGSGSMEKSSEREDWQVRVKGKK